MFIGGDNINNHEFLFEKHEKESAAWSDEFFRVVNEGNEQKLSELLSKVNKLNVTNHKLYNYINNYTLDNLNKNQLKNDTKYIKTLENVIDVSYTEKSLNITTDKVKINVMKLNDVFELLETDPIIGTSSRKGMCHDKSLFLSLCLNMDTFLLTGYIYGLSDKNKYLHSVVEITLKDKKYILDYTLNSIINKEGYDYLMNFEELSRISKDSLINDYKLFDGFSKLNMLGIGTKEYLVYRDEIMKNLNKNKEIIVQSSRKKQ